MMPHSVAMTVGQNILENPSPNWNASTAICLCMPMESARFAIIGMDTAACPEPDGMKKLRMFCTMTMPTAAMPLGTSVSALDM